MQLFFLVIIQAPQTATVIPQGYVTHFYAHEACRISMQNVVINLQQHLVGKRKKNNNNISL